jgi:hypothetical protein
VWPRVTTGQEEGAAEEIDTEPDEAAGGNEDEQINEAIMERWYGMHEK